jgi:hypothetical protein
MDTLNFEPERFDSPQSRRDDESLVAATNLSDVEVFMLRGRRLQAQAVGGALRRGLAKLRRLLRRSHGQVGSPRQPGCQA